MVSRELLIWTLTGAETTTWGILARTSATLMEAPAGLMPMRLLALLGRTNMSIPMPFWRVLNPLSLPIRMAVMERIMMTSMAMARQLMSERRGRWTRLPATNLFILVPVYGNRWRREGCGCLTRPLGDAAVGRSSGAVTACEADPASAAGEGECG